MRWSALILLLPAMIQASCTDDTDPAYNLAISQGNSLQAFDLIARELHLSSNDKSHFKIIPGYSDTHDDRHGQADPDNLEIDLDPGLFIEGKEGACQGVIHELTHLRQFERDRRRLHAYYSTHPIPEQGWKDCDHQILSGTTPSQAEDEAYACLQDNDFASHEAAMDLEAVLAQIPFATKRMLREEDLNYLVENLALWSSHQTMITDHSNESYYLPEIKREDIHAFCDGAKQGFERHADLNQVLGAWRYFCRVKH